MAFLLSILVYTLITFGFGYLCGYFSSPNCNCINPFEITSEDIQRANEEMINSFESHNENQP